MTSRLLISCEIALSGWKRNNTMSKVLCYSGIATAAMLLILFSLDLALGVPFKKADTLLDIIFMVSSTGLGFISWLTLRELK